MRKTQFLVVAIAALVVAAGGCSSTTTKTPPQLATCTLVTPTEASQVLGSAATQRSLSEKTCIYTAGQSGAMLILQSVPVPSLPGRTNNAGKKVTVHGVTALYQAPGSIVTSQDTTPANPLSAVLVFTHHGYFVRISVQRGADPENQAKQTMAYIVPRLA